MGGGKEKTEFKISFTPRAYRSFAGLLKANEKLARRISGKIDSLSRKPMMGKPLRGQWKGHRSLRVGDYRIIYKVDTVKREILIINVRHRREVYDR